MITYQFVYENLGLPEPLIDCACGRIEIPVSGWSAPANYYGFPPALVPLVSNGSGPAYFGYWKHWFSNREPTFVKMYVGSCRLVIEVARTPEQFFCLLALMALTIDEGISPAVQQFCSSTGISNLRELETVSLKSGDEPSGFSVLRQFKRKAPLTGVKITEEYNGSFPTGDFNDSRKWWEDACSFEVPIEVMSAWPKELPRKPWLVPGSKAHVFDVLLTKGDLHGAWMTLNFSGWKIRDAIGALTTLAGVAKNHAFEQLASTWCAVAVPSIEDY